MKLHQVSAELAESELSDVQRAIAEAIADPLDDRTFGDLSTAFGVPPRTLYAWRRRPAFRALLESLTADLEHIGQTRGMRRLMLIMENGEDRDAVAAIRTLFQATGRISTGTNVVTNVNQETHVNAVSEGDLLIQIDEAEAELARERAEVERIRNRLPPSAT